MNRAKGIVVGLLLLSTRTGLLLGQSRGCTKVPSTTATRWGGNERVVLDHRNKPVRMVRGTVTGPGEGIYKTLIQVFPQKPSDLHSLTSGQENGLPIAACETGGDGAFTFHLPPGEYELLMSQDGGVDVTAVLVSVKRGWHRSRKIRAVMVVGT
jgi:hypothetical protein